MSGADGGEKARLRSEVKAALNALSPDEHVKRSRAACERFLASPSYARAQILFAYVSFGRELSSFEVLNRALRDGKTLGLPHSGAGSSRILTFHAVRDLKLDLAAGRFGIAEPLTTLPILSGERADVILVPGVAFTARGERLGQGGGFYDRYLSQPGFRAERCALAFESQIRETVPLQPHDFAVDVIFTEDRVLAARS